MGTSLFYSLISFGIRGCILLTLLCLEFKGRFEILNNFDKCFLNHFAENLTTYCLLRQQDYQFSHSHRCFPQMSDHVCHCQSPSYLRPWIAGERGRMEKKRRGRGNCLLLYNFRLQGEPNKLLAIGKYLRHNRSWVAQHIRHNHSGTQVQVLHPVFAFATALGLFILFFTLTNYSILLFTRGAFTKYTLIRTYVSSSFFSTHSPPHKLFTCSAEIYLLYLFLLF